MNVVVSAIVDPWVTTLSFVVALAMRIQARKSSPWRENRLVVLLARVSATKLARVSAAERARIDAAKLVKA